MDLVDPDASTDYALQAVQWCTQNSETETLRTVLKTNFKESNLSEFAEECAQILFTSLASQNNTALKILLHHVDDNFLKQTFGNEKKTFLTKLLCSAVETDKSDKIEYLVKKGADANFSYQGKPVLHYALDLGHVVVAKALVESGASLTTLDRRGNGVLAAAILSPIDNKAQIVRWLIDKGADPKQKSSSGKLPIHMAATCCADTVDVLLRSGCDINIKDDIHGETALHHACNSCCKETILRLIQSGAAFNLVNKRGETPLHKLLRFAVDYHDFHAKVRMDVARHLMSVGFKMTPYQSKGQVPKRKGRDKISDVHKTLKATFIDVPTLQSITRAELRETLSSDMFRKKLDLLDVPRHLKSYLLCKDLNL